MPAIEITDAKGLVQVTGTGVTASSAVSLSSTVNTTEGFHASYTAATGYGPSDLIVGKGGSSISADPFTQGTVQLFPIGAKLIYGDRTFRYAKLAAGAVTAGKTVAAAAVVNANHRDCAAVATTAGSSEITVTLGNTATTLNQYADGYLHVNDGPAQGLLLRIKSHPAADGNNTCVFTMYDPLGVVALTTGSKIDLILNPYSALVIAPTTFVGPILGVTAMDSTGANFVWIQTAGPASCLYTQNPTGANYRLGDLMIRDDSVAGSIMGLGAVAGDADMGHQVIGTLYVLNGASDNVVVWLNNLDA